MAADKTKLSAIVGADNVVAEPALLSSFASAGGVSGGEPSLIVRPHATAEVRELIKLARQDKLNLVFTSSSPPRLRRDSVPTGEAVIVEPTAGAIHVLPPEPPR